MIRNRLILILPLLLCLAPGWAAAPRVFVIEVQGLACPFCIHALKQDLGKLPGVAEVEIDLATGIAHLTLEPGVEPDIDAIRETILQAGFTPGQVRSAGGG